MLDHHLLQNPDLINSSPDDVTLQEVQEHIVHWMVFSEYQGDYVAYMEYSMSSTFTRFILV